MPPPPPPPRRPLILSPMCLFSWLALQRRSRRRAAFRSTGSTTAPCGRRSGSSRSYHLEQRLCPVRQARFHKRRSLFAALRREDQPLEGGRHHCARTGRPADRPARPCDRPDDPRRHRPHPRGAVFTDHHRRCRRLSPFLPLADRGHEGRWIDCARCSYCKRYRAESESSAASSGSGSGA
jgi:hypothetical protein